MAMSRENDLQEIAAHRNVDIGNALKIARPTLDDVFLTLTGHSLRDAEPAAEGRPS